MHGFFKGKSIYLSSGEMISFVLFRFNCFTDVAEVVEIYRWLGPESTTDSWILS